MEAGASHVLPSSVDPKTLITFLAPPLNAQTASKNLSSASTVKAHTLSVPLGVSSRLVHVRPPSAEWKSRSRLVCHCDPYAPVLKQTAAQMSPFRVLPMQASARAVRPG